MGNDQILYMELLIMAMADNTKEMNIVNTKLLRNFENIANVIMPQ
jgi:hypothetical protein